LTKIDAAQKAKVIKEVKQVMPNMNLVEAKKFVENLPQTLKENVPKEDVEKLKKALEAVGAAVEVS
jgi:large subunit ribosomal protein L7/L12